MINCCGSACTSLLIKLEPLSRMARWLPGLLLLTQQRYCGGAHRAARTSGFITPLGVPVDRRRTVLREAPDGSKERRDGSKSLWRTVTGTARAVGSWTSGLVTQRAPETPVKEPRPPRLELPRWLNRSAADGPAQTPPPSTPAIPPQQTTASSLVSAAAAAVSDAFDGSGGSSDSDAPSTAGVSAVSRQRRAGTTRDAGSEGGGTSGGGGGSGGSGGVGAWFSGVVRRVQNGTANAAATTAIVLSGGGTPAPLPPAERAKRLLDAAIPARQSQMDASFLNVILSLRGGRMHVPRSNSVCPVFSS